MDRFTAVEQFFRKSPKSGDLGQTAKGLVFVQIYAIYEYTIRNVTRIAINKIAAHSHPFIKLRSPLLAIFLHQEICSLVETSERNRWEKRLQLFERSLSKSPITAVNAIPHDGSHFRCSQTSMILRALGVKRRFTRLRRHPPRIDEVVEHRNAIAHGEETAQQVGRRYSRADIYSRIRLMRSVCLRLINIVSEHCDLPERHRR
jgi:hypothetical protein